MKYKVLCTDGFSESGLNELKKNSYLEVDYYNKLTHEELIDKIPSYHGLIIRSSSEVTKDVIESGNNLKIIARAGVGTDNIDINAATEKGIIVVNAPSGNTTSTAELSFAMLLSLSRNIPQAAKSMSDGKWEKNQFKGSEVAYKTLGIIGLGRIGREVAKRALAFKMKVIGYDPHIEADTIKDFGITPVDLNDIYKNSDYITTHTPLNEKTKNLISQKEINMMKPSVRIINCARGGIVNENDLAKALIDKRIAGAALDVYTTEPFSNDIFKGLNNCILTPHLGASTAEAQEAVASEVAYTVAQFFKDGISSNAVNLPGVTEQSLSQYKQHIVLAEKLGTMCSQICEGNIESIIISSTNKVVPIVSLAAIKGVLKKCVNKDVSVVNARKVANDSNIKVVEEIISKKPDYEYKIGIRINDGCDNSATVKGAIFSNNIMKITSYDDYHVDIDPNGSILFIHNNDEPGVMGRVCTILGKYNVNIAGMQNVRKGKGKEALTIIRIDESIDGNTIQAIRNEKGVDGVKQAVL